MRYLLLIYTAESEMPPAPVEGRKMMDAYVKVTQEFRERGLLEHGEALQPTTTATTVRVRDAVWGDAVTATIVGGPSQAGAPLGRAAAWRSPPAA